MGLPKIQQPTFDVMIPSSGNKITLRPFVVREEKILLMAQQSADKAEIIKAIRQVVNNCVISPAEFNVDSLATFDLEWVFLKLRAESVSQVIDLKYKDPEDDKTYDVQVDLRQVQIKRPEGHTNKVKINDSVGLTLRYPRVDMLDHLQNAANETEVLLGIIGYCIDIIYDGEEVYKAEDFTRAEVEEFVNSLNIETFKDIQKFLDTMPSLHFETSYTTKAGTERKIELRTLEDFFTLG